jgi:urease subunit alpha
MTFVSAASLADPLGPASLGLARRLEPVRRCRTIRKTDMILNAALPHIVVDPETYRVTADGVHLTCEPAKVLPLAQRYHLF